MVKRTHRISISLSVAALMLSVLVGSAMSAAGGNPYVKKSPPTIGYSIQSAQDPYWQGYVHGIKVEAKKLGYTKIFTSDSQASAATQVSGSAALIADGISGLIVSPQDPSALPATITAAHNAKIPVIVGDVGATGAYDAYIDSNNYNGGVLAAQFISKALAKKPGVQEVAVIELLPTTSVNKPRTDGFTQTIAKDKHIKVVAKPSGQQTLSGGFAAAKAILAAHPKIAAIYAENDSMATGASQVLIQAHKNPVTGVVVVGFNGDPIGLTNLGKGKIAADVAQNPYLQGKLAVDDINSLLNGKSLTFQHPAIKTQEIPVELVTPQNLKAFLKRVKAGTAY
jgi:ribose transport system substrate-binding protein